VGVTETLETIARCTALSVDFVSGAAREDAPDPPVLIGTGSASSRLHDRPSFVTQTLKVIRSLLFPLSSRITLGALLTTVRDCG
jgi:hypothetical protein